MKVWILNFSLIPETYLSSFNFFHCGLTILRTGTGSIYVLECGISQIFIASLEHGPLDRRRGWREAENRRIKEDEFTEMLITSSECNNTRKGCLVAV